MGVDKVVEDERLVGLEGVAIHVEQSRGGVGGEQFEQAAADESGAFHFVVAAGGLVGVGVNKVDDAALFVAHGLEHDVGVEERIQGGVQAGAFHFQGGAGLHHVLDVLPTADEVSDGAGIVEGRAYADGEPVVAVGADADAQFDLEADPVLEPRLGRGQTVGIVGMDKVAELPADELLGRPSGADAHRRGDPLDEAVPTAAEDDVGGVLGEQAVFLLAPGEVVADLHLIGDVGDGDAAEVSVIAVFCHGDHLETGPEKRAVRLEQAQFASLRRAVGQEFLPRQIKDVLIFRKNDAAERKRGKLFAGHCEQVGRGEVGFKDDVVVVERDVADGGEIEEFEVARAFDVDRGLQAAQFLVLHFQFDLVHEEFVQCLLGIHAGPERFAHLGHGGFCAVAQDGGLVFRRRAHTVLFRMCSVVATA